MPKFIFIRSVPLLVEVEAETSNEAWVAAGARVDDFMSDANESIERIAHNATEKPYRLEYHGDAIYGPMLAAGSSTPSSS
jgi:hypothetical protein